MYLVKNVGEPLKKYAYSVRFWILIVAAVYLGYALYFAVYGLNFSLDLTHNQYVYNALSKNPWWWFALYYGSEGVAGSVAIVLRAFAGIFAFYAALNYWRGGNPAISTVKKNAVRALGLEAGFFLALIPSIIAAFVYNVASDPSLFYFEHTPELLLLFGTAIPCLALVCIVAPFLLKLRSNVKRDASLQEIKKWAALTGVSYLFVVFWFNYLMLWVANMFPYPRAGEGFGLAFLMQPANFVSFALTIFGLLAIAIIALFTLLPVIKKLDSAPNLTRVGGVLVGFGGYFVFTVLYYYLTGSYEAHPSVWYEVISPMHNPNLWALALIFVGIPLIIGGSQGKRANVGS